MYSNESVIKKLSNQYGVISRSQAMAAGMTSQQVTRAITGRTWRRLHPGVYQLSGSPSTPHAQLLAACLATKGTASHQSAAWLWGLLRRPPPVPTVTVSGSRRPRCSGIVVHRSAAPPREPRATLRSIPCTNARRTALDLAAVAVPICLDDAIDRGVARGLFTVSDLVAECRQQARPGRPGIRALRSALKGRGYVGAPHPSVLESLVLRLLDRGGIRPLGVEVEVEARSGRYRLDVTLAERLALEVDGYAYHFDPDAMARDHRRRRELAQLGWKILVFTWLDVTRDGDEVLGAVRRALDVPS